MKPTGGCQCGAIRYRLNTPPITVYACHCSHCQKQASSAFGISVWVREEDFVLVAGTLQFWEVRGDSGRLKCCGFCGQCGSRIYHRGRAGSDMGEGIIFSVKGGTLDDARKLEPAAHIWVRSAHHWLELGRSERLVFETEPDDFDLIIQAYSQRSSS